jgi:hypothetical protein
VELLRAEIDIGLNAVDALDRKLALVPVLLGTVAALLVPTEPGPLQVIIVGMGSAVAFLAVGLALWGLVGIPIEIGPEQEWLSKQAESAPATFYKKVAARQKMSVASLNAATASKSKRFNLALFASSWAMLFFLVSRVVPGG